MAQQQPAQKRPAARTAPAAAAQSKEPAREIEISRWRKYEKNSLRGYFSATLTNGMIINKLALFEKDNSCWIKTPSELVTDSEGQRYQPLIEFRDREIGKDFNDAILAALYHFFETHEH